jgi:hypothetical protein
MSTEAIPGSGHDGQEPSGPALADGFPGEDEDAWLRRVMAEADADEEWVPEEQVQAALSGLGGAVRAGGDPGGLAQDGVTGAMAPGPGLAALAAGACDPAVLPELTDNQVLGLAGAGLPGRRPRTAPGPHSRTPAAGPAADSRTGGTGHGPVAPAGRDARPDRQEAMRSPALLG